MNQIQFMTTLNRVILLKQSFFGLPWVLVAAILPEKNGLTFSLCLLIIFAFLTARFFGMCCNRLIDHKIDVQNPRTSSRPLPANEISRSTVMWLGLFSLACFLWIIANINPLCLKISPIIIALLVGYSFTKRSTWLCHLILGIVQFFAPLCAWIVVTGSISLGAVFLSSALGLSIAAGDILYAFQDIEFDRQQKLYSIPACLGPKIAVIIAKWLHILSLMALVALGVISSLSWVYFLGVASIAMIFFQTHKQFSITTIDHLFSLCNTYAGIILLLATVGDILWRVL